MTGHIAYQKYNSESSVLIDAKTA